MHPYINDGILFRPCYTRIDYTNSSQSHLPRTWDIIPVIIFAQTSCPRTWNQFSRHDLRTFWLSAKWIEMIWKAGYDSAHSSTVSIHTVQSGGDMFICCISVNPVARQNSRRWFCNNYRSRKCPACWKIWWTGTGGPKIFRNEKKTVHNWPTDLNSQYGCTLRVLVLLLAEYGCWYLSPKSSENHNNEFELVTIILWP